jgi:hypothetical protein
MRPMISPALRRLWRDRETLQLGRPPGRSVVLAGVDPGARATLALLDGTRDAVQVLSEATAVGCPPERAAALLDLLDGAGLLDDAATPSGTERYARPERDRLAGDAAALALVSGATARAALARRSSARVRVLGAGRVGAAVAGLLAAAGVGAVDVDDPAPARAEDAGVGGLDLADVGRPRDEATRERLRSLAPSVDLSPGPADLVVVAPTGAGRTDEALRDLAGGVAHLPAEVRDGVGAVGPLVLPGRSACLHCVDLTRADLDPDWPSLAAQLSHPGHAPTAAAGVLAVATAAQAAAQALALLDGGPLPAAVGGTLEAAPPDWRWRRRSWHPHPDCGCVRRAG